MIPAKQKVQIGKAPRQKAKSPPDTADMFSPAPPGPAERDILELFPDDKPAPPATKLRWRGCAVCGAKDTLPAHPSHDVCQRCTAEPAAAGESMARQRRILVLNQEQALSTYKNAMASLSAADALRWETFCDLWILCNAGMASEDDARKVAATLDAYKRPDHPRIGPALRRTYEAWEGLFFADEAAKAGCKLLDVKLAQLGVCLEDLGRKNEADALYKKGARA